MQNGPRLVTLRTVTDTSVLTKCYTPNGEQWLPARCLHLCSFCDRIKLAWMVFTGKADAYQWPEDQFRGNDK